MLIHLQNTSLAIKFFKFSPVWTFNTRVILLFSNSQDTTITIADNLLQFTAAGIFNVAILLPRFEQRPCTFLYHNPFTSHRKGYFYTVRNPTSIEDGFPNKVKNLYEHKFNIFVTHAPPHVIIRNNSVAGTRKYLFDIFLDRLNATYEYKFKRLDLGNSSPQPHLDQLYINDIFFTEMGLTKKIDIQPAYGSDQFRIMVKYRHLTDVNAIMINYFISRNDVQVSGIFLGALVVYLIFIKRSFNLADCPTYGIHFWAISIHQNSNLKVEKTDKSRIFFSSLFIFAFITIIAFESQLTSKLVAFTPYKSVENFNQVIEDNISVYGHPTHVDLIRNAKYNLSADLLNQFQVRSTFPWRADSRSTEEAFIISLNYNQFFFKSALNRNENGYEKFYLLDYVVTTVPTINVFPKYSPYQGEFTEMYSHIFEAGLNDYWLTKTLNRDIWEDWHWHTKIREVKNRNIDLRKLAFAFSGIAYGWIAALTALLFELFVYYWCPRIKKYWTGLSKKNQNRVKIYKIKQFTMKRRPR